MSATTIEWRKTLKTLLERGLEISPDSMGANWRGRTNKEILGYRTRVPMSNPVVVDETRKLGFRFMCAEAAAILAGDNSLAYIKPFSKQMEKMSEDGLTMTGHYGPPYRDQVSYVLQALRKDPCSRQAVITLWRPRPGLGTEIPCTIALQFLLRAGTIHTLVTMRSSDAWMGLPYDWFAFSMMTAYIALALDPRPALGELLVSAGSQHLYKLDWELAAQAAADETFKFEIKPFDMEELKHPNDLIDHLKNVANKTNHFRGGPKWLLEF